MKNREKILILGLSDGLKDAFSALLVKNYDVLTHAKKDDITPDIWPQIVGIITTEGQNVAWPGTPVLHLSSVRKGRLNDLGRYIDYMVQHPALYIDDIPLPDATFVASDRIIHTKGEDIILTDREADILCFLARHHQTPVQKQDLLQNVWRYHADIDTHTLETHIYRLRQKMGDWAQYLMTDGAGYQLTLDDTLSCP